MNDSRLLLVKIPRGIIEKIKLKVSHSEPALERITLVCLHIYGPHTAKELQSYILEGDHAYI